MTEMTMQNIFVKNSIFRVTGIGNFGHFSKCSANSTLEPHKCIKNHFQGHILLFHDRKPKVVTIFVHGNEAAQS